MLKLLSRFTEPAYTLTRIVVGAAFAEHGAQKLLGLLGGHQVPLFSLTGLAGVIELGCGVLVALGLLTSYAALLASGEMAVAYFRSHAPAGFWPIQNRGELAVVYCFIFLFIATRGGGRWVLSRK